MAQLADTAPAIAGCAAVEEHSVARGALIGVSLHPQGPCGDGHKSPVLFWLPDRGEPSQSVEEAEAHLMAALESDSAAAPTEGEIERARMRLWPALRAQLAEADRGRWSRHRASPESRMLARRLHQLARAAARRRDAMALASADRGLRFVALGHTAGEEMLTVELLALSDRALLERLHHLPLRSVASAPLLPVITGVLIFR